jgi:hypothetical protein
MNNLWPSRIFQFLAIQLRYQLVSAEWRVIQTFYSHISVCKSVSNKNLSKLFQEGN